MTAAEVATFLGVHRLTVHRLVRQGILQSFFVGRLRRFTRAEVEAATAAIPGIFSAPDETKFRLATPQFN
jgi:excisionase family DNA binding protein